MSELLQVVETIRAEEASIDRLFNNPSGDVRLGVGKRTKTPQYMSLLNEAAALVADVMNGRKRVHYLQEAMTTSDFPLLFGDIIDRMLLANYRETPATYRNYCHVSQVRDFRTVKRFVVNGGEGQLSIVPQRSEYPYDSVSDGDYTYSVSKYGKKFMFAWEDIINDDLEALTDIPQRMARSARRTEQKFASGLFWGTSGPNGTFFSSGNKNIVTANPALSVAGLQTAMTVMASQLDSSGEPIDITAVRLVVPPALKVTAMNLLHASALWLTSLAGGVSGEQVNAQNWMANVVELDVDPYIPIIASSSNGSTSWMLVADPNEGRPAAEIGFLRGHAEPEMFMKSANATTIGGGLSSEMDGDFDSDSIEYKIRHVLGGTLMDPKMAVASNGSGS